MLLDIAKSNEDEKRATIELQSLKEELAYLDQQIEIYADDPCVAILCEMRTSIRVQIAFWNQRFAKSDRFTPKSPKNKPAQLKAHLVSTNNGKPRFKVRKATVKRNKEDIVNIKDFHCIDRVYMKLFNNEEWIVDYASLERPYDKVMAVRIAPTWAIVPVVSLYYEIRNIRTFKNKVIAKRKNKGHYLRYQEGYCPASLNL
ncbi:hypothetical protein [Listeria booriae]|uniref:hypothetical protein n=1 Tax=Listeria booriae TaxID=1552123 RepID=UPI00162A2B18|nr:hypothetical protein [Listeria booriae]MBC2164629.1 hypothetical protein [Listeria booriae]